MRLVRSCWAILLGCITLYYGVISQDSLPDHPILQGKNDLFLHAMAFLSLTMPIFVLWQTWRSLMAESALPQHIAIAATDSLIFIFPNHIWCCYDNRAPKTALQPPEAETKNQLR